MSIPTFADFQAALATSGLVARHCTDGHWQIRHGDGRLVADYWPTTGKFRMVGDGGRARTGDVGMVVSTAYARTAGTTTPGQRPDEPHLREPKRSDGRVESLNEVAQLTAKYISRDNTRIRDLGYGEAKDMLRLLVLLGELGISWESEDEIPF